MKMNKFIYQSLLVLIIFSLSSCDNLLDIPPQGKLVKQDFWLSEDHAVAAIAGIYSSIGASSFSGASNGLSANEMSAVESYIYWGEIRGELLASNSGVLPSDQINKEKLDNLNVSPADVTTKYTQFYKIINYANQAIKYIPTVKDSDPAFTEDLEKELIAEAYFLRAFAYFWLTRTFKEVPLFLEPAETDLQNYDIPKSGSEELYTQIVSDLNKAIEDLPSWYSNTNYSHSRATKYAAKVVLADVSLTMASLGIGDESGNYDQVISLCDDILSSFKYTLVPGSSYGSIFTNGASDETIFETYANRQLNNQTNYFYNWFSRGYFVVSSAADQLYEDKADDYRSATPPSGPYPEAGVAVTYLSSSKYIYKYYSSTRDSRWIFYRLPEVYFMKAEALAHRYVDNTDKLLEACELVNEVRHRAFGLTNFPKVEAQTTSEMDNIILDERGREFLGEGKRWFELVRFASRDNFANKELLINRVLQSYNGTDQLQIGPRLRNQDGWYLPINSAALDASPSLIQNPFYQ